MNTESRTQSPPPSTSSSSTSPRSASDIEIEDVLPKKPIAKKDFHRQKRISSSLGAMPFVQEILLTTANDNVYTVLSPNTRVATLLHRKNEKQEHSNIEKMLLPGEIPILIQQVRKEINVANEFDNDVHSQTLDRSALMAYRRNSSKDFNEKQVQKLISGELMYENQDGPSFSNTNENIKVSKACCILS